MNLTNITSQTTNEDASACMCLLCECLHRNVHICAVPMCAVLLICVAHFYKEGGYAARVEQIGTEERFQYLPQ